MTNTMTEHIAMLIEGAKLNKIVEVYYRYLKKDQDAEQRHGLIQPLKWVQGKNGTLQVLTWDTEVANWRRFEVENIESIHVTNDPWTNTTLEETITTTPYH